MEPLHQSRAFFDLLAGSHRRLVGRPLVPEHVATDDGPRRLYQDAPFGILAHGTAADPIFIYGNRTAQRRFGYDWDELTTLPSRLSAEAPERQARADFLDRVSRFGFVEGYRGMRVRKSGERFWIEGVTVWQLIDENGTRHGQAALLP